jgi:hypothetical protein
MRHQYCIKAGENLCFAFKTYVKKLHKEMQEKHPTKKVEICHMQDVGLLELVEISDEEYAELGIEREG